MFLWKIFQKKIFVYKLVLKVICLPVERAKKRMKRVCKYYPVGNQKTMIQYFSQCKHVLMK